MSSVYKNIWCIQRYLSMGAIWYVSVSNVYFFVGGVFDQPSVDQLAAWPDGSSVDKPSACPIVLWPTVLDQPSFDQTSVYHILVYLFDVPVESQMRIAQFRQHASHWLPTVFHCIYLKYFIKCLIIVSLASLINNIFRFIVLLCFAGGIW